MKVLFDAYWWVSGPFSNRTVQRELIRAWAADYPDDELTLLVPRSALAEAARDTPSGARLVGTRLAPHGLACALGAAWAGRRTAADLIVTHNFAPVAGRSVVFIHDVLFQTDPEWFTASERVYFAGMPLLAPRAELVATSSSTEASRIREQNPRLRRVLPIGLAIRTELLDAVPVPPARLAGIDRFVLTVGRLNRRKNLVTTMSAALAGGRVSPSTPLVVVGERDGRFETVPEHVRRAIDEGSIIVLSSVTDAELAWLYGHARLFVFLTLDEGFGLTPTEALAFGCRCVVSDIPVFRESLEGLVRFVDPLDPVAAAAAIVAALDEPEAERTVTRRGTWSECVERLRRAVAR